MYIYSVAGEEATAGAGVGVELEPAGWLEVSIYLYL